MDLDRKIFFSNIVETNLRPDVVLQQSKTCHGKKVVRKYMGEKLFMVDCKGKG